LKEGTSCNSRRAFKFLPLFYYVAVGPVPVAVESSLGAGGAAEKTITKSKPGMQGGGVEGPPFPPLLEEDGGPCWLELVAG